MSVDLLHFEDFGIGRVFALGPKTVTADEIIHFASQFDPQPMHLDEEAGRASILGGLSASGWHTCSILMRMFFDAIVSRSASEGGPGIDDMAWKRPVIAGDTLTGTCTVVEARASNSRPAIGIVTLRHELVNQAGEIVAVMIHPVMVRRREVAA